MNNTKDTTMTTRSHPHQIFTEIDRALKDHENPDLSNLHVAVDPRTMLLVRS